jgi:hypothetical protein
MDKTYGELYNELMSLCLESEKNDSSILKEIDEKRSNLLCLLMNECLPGGVLCNKKINCNNIID